MKLQYPDNLINAILEEVLSINCEQLSKLEKWCSDYGWTLEYFKERKTYKEIASIHGVSPYKAKKVVNAPIKMLQNNLSWLHDIFDGLEENTKPGMKLIEQREEEIFIRLYNKIHRVQSKCVDLYTDSIAHPERYSEAVAAYKMRHPNSIIPVEPIMKYIAKLENGFITFYTDEEEEHDN